MLGKRSTGSTRRLFSCNIWKAFNRRLLSLQKTLSYFMHHSGKSRTDFVLKDGHLEMPAQQTCETYVTSNGKQGVPYGAKPPRRRLTFFVLPLQNHPKHVCLVRGRATRLVCECVPPHCWPQPALCHSQWQAIQEGAESPAACIRGGGCAIVRR